MARLWPIIGACRSVHLVQVEIRQDLTKGTIINCKYHFRLLCVCDGTSKRRGQLEYVCLCLIVLPCSKIIYRNNQLCQLSGVQHDQSLITSLQTIPNKIVIPTKFCLVDAVPLGLFSHSLVTPVFYFFLISNFREVVR